MPHGLLTVRYGRARGRPVLRLVRPRARHHRTPRGAQVRLDPVRRHGGVDRVRRRCRSRGRPRAQPAVLRGGPREHRALRRGGREVRGRRRGVGVRCAARAQRRCRTCGTRVALDPGWDPRAERAAPRHRARRAGRCHDGRGDRGPGRGARGHARDGRRREHRGAAAERSSTRPRDRRRPELSADASRVPFRGDAPRRGEGQARAGRLVAGRRSPRHAGEADVRDAAGRPRPRAVPDRVGVGPGRRLRAPAPRDGARARGDREVPARARGRRGCPLQGRPRALGPQPPVRGTEPVPRRRGDGSDAPPASSRPNLSPTLGASSRR